MAVDFMRKNYPQRRKGAKNIQEREPNCSCTRSKTIAGEMAFKHSFDFSYLQCDERQGEQGSSIRKTLSSWP
jgi:hypothetical protein